MSMRTKLNVEVIGIRQAVVVQRARQSKPGMVMPAGYLESRACRRLVARGLLRIAVAGQEFTVYALTERGRSCWLAVQ